MPHRLVSQPSQQSAPVVCPGVSHPFFTTTALHVWKSLGFGGQLFCSPFWELGIQGSWLSHLFQRNNPLPSFSYPVPRYASRGVRYPDLSEPRCTPPPKFDDLKWCPRSISSSNFATWGSDTSSSHLNSSSSSPWSSTTNGCTTSCMQSIMETLQSSADKF